MNLNYDEYHKKVLGCWMGKNIGGTLGAPFEWRRQVNAVSFYTQDLGGEPLPNDDLDIQLLWLTDHESRDEKTVPPTLERIIAIIEEFMNENKRSIVLLDDIQYLIGNTSFDGVIRFLRMLVDQVSEREAIFLLSLNPESLRSQERSILEREMEVIKASGSD